MPICSAFAYNLPCQQMPFVFCSPATALLIDMFWSSHWDQETTIVKGRAPAFGKMSYYGRSRVRTQFASHKDHLIVAWVKNLAVIARQPVSSKILLQTANNNNIGS